jgi:hypothetical protein
MLPEEVFGLYAYLRIWCPRCGKTIAERAIEEQIEVLMGYVSLWNDVRPIVEAARALERLEWSETAELLTLRAALRRYEKLYPEHIAA